jgi:hypothetical protein
VYRCIQSFLVLTSELLKTRGLRRANHPWLAPTISNILKNNLTETPSHNTQSIQIDTSSVFLPRCVAGCSRNIEECWRKFQVSHFSGATEEGVLAQLGKISSRSGTFRPCIHLIIFLVSGAVHPDCLLSFRGPWINLLSASSFAD